MPRSAAAYRLPRFVPVVPPEPSTGSIAHGAVGEVRRAHLVLLRHPVVDASVDPAGYRLVQHHLQTLRTWHRHRTGWTILARGHTLRLVRAVGVLPMGLLHPELTAPRDVACFAWALAFAHHPRVAARGIGRQFLLTEVATAIAEASRDPVAPLDFARRADARSLRRALRALVDLGLLQAVDGSDEAWLDADGAGDALYEFTDAATTFLAGLDRQALDAVGQHTRETAPTLPGRMVALAELPPLMRAWRALLGAPVLVRYDDPEAFDALWQARHRVALDMEQAVDDLLDLTPSYARLVRPSGASDSGEPRLSPRRALDHAVLCFCSHLRTAVTSGALGPPDPDSDCVFTTRADLARTFEETVAVEARRWGRQLQARAKLPDLFEDVCAAMRRLGLLRGPDQAGAVVLLPTAAAYAVSYIVDPAPISASA
jgi:uncharacterized protein (TIGR02678 family)